MPHFLPAKFFRAGHISDLALGELFIPTVGEDDYFVAGELQGRKVLIALSDADACHYALPEEWNRPDGLIVPGIEFEPDLESSTTRYAACDKPGNLVITEAGVALTAINQGTPRAVALRGELGNLEKCSGFRNWQVTVGSGDEKAVLFTRAVRPAA